MRKTKAIAHRVETEIITVSKGVVVKHFRLTHGAAGCRLGQIFWQLSKDVKFEECAHFERSDVLLLI